MTELRKFVGHSPPILQGELYVGTELLIALCVSFLGSYDK